MKTLLLILDLRKAWKSKTLTLGRILTILPVFDLAFFQGETGLRIVELVAKVVNAGDLWKDFSNTQVATGLVVTLGWVISELRARTTVPLEEKH